MFSPTMRTALLQAIVLWTISMMLDHHYYQNIFSQVIENEAVMSLNNALNISHSTSTSSAPGQLALDAGNTTNITLSLNHTLDLANATAPRLSNAAKQPQESFYRQLLPREAFVFLVVSALQYWWHIFLERILPARPKSRSAPSEKEVEHSEDREEEVVKKWVAQGRVRRSSLNWCNTFLKWVLELTVGRLWYHSVSHGVRILLKPEDPKLPLRGLKSHLAINFVAAYVSSTPLATLIAFVIVPAHKRVVFMTGADLVLSIFMNTLVSAFATWAVKTDFVQRTIRDFTAHIENPQLWEAERRRRRRGREEL